MTNTRILYTAILNGIILTIIALLFSLAVVPMRYSADARILIAPRAIPGVDPYTSTKAAERIAQNLGQVVGSSQFFKRVISLSANNIDLTYFPTDELKRRKLWSRTVEASVVYNTGILHIRAFHPERDQAVKIAQSVTQLLATSGNDFAITSSDFRVMDAPVASRYPTKPNFAVIGLVSFLGGALVTAIFLGIKHRI